MRETYIKQVRKELIVHRKLKKEILRDLNEAFDSAQEHGESPQQVIKRLGTPKEFAENILESTGFNVLAYRKRQKNQFIFVFSCLFAVIGFALFILSQTPSVPEGVIGQADATTTILVESSYPVSIPHIILALAFICTCVAGFYLTRLIFKKRV